MLSIGRDESPKLVLLERRRSSSHAYSSLNDGLPRRSFSYHKLPRQLFNLSVLKLDGSSFDFQVARTASVDELKQAVEDVFSQSPKGGEGNISWSHVWGHFCLCHEGQKLINDKDYIQSFGIKDGDQLHFIRHLSINYNPIKRRSKRRSPAYEQSTMLLTGSDVCEEREETGDGQEENDKYSGCEGDEDEEFIGHPEFKLAHFLRGCLSYSRLWFMGRRKSDGKVRPSRLSGHFLRVGSKFTLTRL